MMVVAGMMKVETMAGITVEIMTTIIERKPLHHSTDMKIFLLLSTVIAMLATGECSMFSSSRNTTNDRDHPGNGNIENHASGMQHGDSQ
jgi:hypothetical protein